MILGTNHELHKFASVIPFRGYCLHDRQLFWHNIQYLKIICIRHPPIVL